MTTDQIEQLAHLIADQLKSLIWEQVAEDKPPIKPANLDRLFISSDDAKTFIEGHLREAVFFGAPALKAKRGADQSPAAEEHAP